MIEILSLLMKTNPVSLFPFAMPFQYQKNPLSYLANRLENCIKLLLAEIRLFSVLQLDNIRQLVDQVIKGMKVTPLNAIEVFVSQRG